MRGSVSMIVRSPPPSPSPSPSPSPGLGLTHETSEALEGARDARVRGHLDEDIVDRLDVYPQLPGLVEGAVEQREEELVGDVGTGERRVPPELPVQSLVVVAVEQLEALRGQESTERGFVT
jgi:hypothetical protein